MNGKDKDSKDKVTIRDVNIPFIIATEKRKSVGINPIRFVPNKDWRFLCKSRIMSLDESGRAVKVCFKHFWLQFHYCAWFYMYNDCRFTTDRLTSGILTSLANHNRESDDTGFLYCFWLLSIRSHHHIRLVYMCRSTLLYNSQS